MIENTNTKQFYPGPILNNTLEITDFLFNDAEQIKVKHSKFNEENILVDVDLNYGTDYEVTKVLSSDINVAEAALTASTGQITLKNVNVLAGEKLTVYRVSQIIQDKDYPRTGAFPAATHEGALDYLTMQNQEQKDEIDRALKVPISTQNFEGSLPLPIPSRALKINNDGTGFEMSEFDPDLALVTTEEFKNQSQQAAAEALVSQNIATEQATIATQQANIATEKTAEVVESGTTAVQNIDTAFNTVNDWFSKLNAIPYIPVGTILPTTGAIDESLGYQRYANGQLIAGASTVAPDLVKFLEFQEAHAPNLLCSETEWQTALTLSTLGQVGKYVWNKEEDSIRIPRIVNIQGMIDMNTVGNMIEAGLPNITGELTKPTNEDAPMISNSIGSTGAFSIIKSNTTGYNSIDTKATANRTFGFAFNASASNPIYGNSNTVQEESILYPYVLQIATGVQYKTPVQNELMSNNPFFFGYYQFFEVAPNNISWLKSAAQWNSAKTHGDYYNWLAEERVNPKDIPVRANVTKVGNIIENDGVLSGFANDICASLPIKPVYENYDTWEMVFDVITGSEISLQQFIYSSYYNSSAIYSGVNIQIAESKFYLSLAFGATSTNQTGSYIVLPNTHYLLRARFTGTAYTLEYSTDNGNTWNTQVNYASTDKVATRTDGYFSIGCLRYQSHNGYRNPWLGTINLKNSYINTNGQRWWSGVKSKVRLHTEDYNDYDWVINQSNQTFRLPLKVLGASGSAVVGNGMGLGLTNGSTQSYLTSYSNPSSTGHGTLSNQASSNVLGSTPSAIPNMYGVMGIATDPTKSGIGTSTQGLSLYFYVGGVAKNEHLVDVGRIEEKLTGYLSLGNKQDIISWGMPDYSATIVPTSPFVAPCNGYLFAVFGSGQTLTMTITQPDGKSHTFDNHGTYQQDMLNVFYPIAKGCKVVSNFPNARYFYPCIGG